MIGAALLAKNAVERGLSRKPWVKTSLAPGSKVVMDYYERAGLIRYLEKLGFHLVGYGCTTCIGNSGPIIDEVSAAVGANDLAVVSVLSGNRNFEGRINPDVKMNYLASPPLVVAYALAGTMDLDLTTEPWATTPTGGRSTCETSGPLRRRSSRSSTGRLRARCSRETTPTFSQATSDGETSAGRPLTRSNGTRGSTYVRKPPYFDGMARDPSPVRDVTGARVLAKLGDSVTTDHISPAGAIKTDSPAGVYLAEHGVERRDFNSYSSRRGKPRGDDPGDVREHSAAQPARAWHLDGGITTIYDASMTYQAAGVPQVILAGKEYGSGSSRDRAAKGTALLGVRAIIAESYERIHRPNLVGMGVLPLQYADRETGDSLGLTGEEEFAIAGVEAINDGTTHLRSGRGHRVPGQTASGHDREAAFFLHGGIRQYVLRSLLDCSRQQRYVLSMTVVEI
jgi:aconitate hydratase